MTPGIKPLVAGNWKMNGVRRALGELAKMGEGYDGELAAKLDMMVCVPYTLLYSAAVACLGDGVQIGAQDCHIKDSGAHTGDISVPMIADCGATAIIVGHSERRTDHAESNELVRQKAEKVLDAGLMAIICIGETQAERESGQTLDVIKNQIAGSVPENAGRGEIVIAYEPVWAIGTGLTPTVEDVAQAHAFMREQLGKKLGDLGQTVRLLYGGSVKPSNAAELMHVDHVDGALVGGASLKADDFLGICAAY